MTMPNWLEGCFSNHFCYVDFPHRPLAHAFLAVREIAIVHERESRTEWFC